MKKAMSTLFAILALASQLSFASEKSITISNEATYYDKKIIAPNIRNECIHLGSEFSNSTELQLSKQGWEVNRDDSLPANGLSLKLVITNVHSSGNAWTGHRKSVSIEAILMKDGETIDSYEHIRKSGGGIGGGFKSSCAVLKRCVDTLGKDVSKWLSRTL
ncbi:MAG: hypothetical protein ACRBBR_09685 [Cellvibrionaceae bacterium]